jgi:pyruvate dehydrogenase E1 component alpha subunit
MFEEWAAQDPIERFRSWLRDHAELTDEEDDEIASSVKRTLSSALDQADESPLPDPSGLEAGVFASPEDLDTPHHK